MCLASLKVNKITLSLRSLRLLAISVALSFGFVALIKILWPSHIPFELFEFFKKCDLYAALIASKWIFLWVFAVTAIVSFLGLNSKEENQDAENGLFNGIILSCVAGLYEEVLYRWLCFMGAMIGAQVMNWICLGFVGLHPIQWLNVHIVVPIADFATAYQMTPYLRTTPWYIATGMLAANASFRDEHKYLGFFGLINSWYMGLFLFYIMFAYGLIPAIIVHVVYDIIYFVVRYIDCIIERKLELSIIPKD